MPAVAKSIASADALLKRMYLGGAEVPGYLIDDVQGPLLAMVESNTNTRFGGKGKAMMPVVSELPAGSSHSYESAYEDAAPSESDDYDIPYREEWKHIFISGNYLTLVKNNSDLHYMEQRAIDDSELAVKACYLRQSWKVWGDTGGALGRLTSDQTLSSTTLNFVNGLAVHRIVRNMWLEFSATDGTSGTVKTGKVKVVSVNRKARTVTINTALNSAVPDIAASDYVFARGDFGKGWAGWASWVPFTHANAATTFYGVDRSVDVQRYAGLRIPLPATERPTTYLAEIARWNREFGKTRQRVVFTTPAELQRLELDLNSRVDVNYGSNPNIGFDNMMVKFKNAPTLSIVADRYLAPPHMPDTTPLYCVTSPQAIRMLMAGKLSWQEYDGSLWRYIPGQNVLQAAYGGLGNFYVPRTDECFVVGDETYVTES